MDRVYVWETYPEYIATQQYSRCLGRILVTIPRSMCRTLAKPMIRSAILIAQGVAGAHAEVGEDHPMPVEERAQFRQAGLDMIVLARRTLHMLQRQRHGDRASVTAALELLERVEDGLRTRPIPGSAEPVRIDV